MPVDFLPTPSVLRELLVHTMTDLNWQHVHQLFFLVCFVFPVTFGVVFFGSSLHVRFVAVGHSVVGLFLSVFITLHSKTTESCLVLRQLQTPQRNVLTD